jgi:hypothetical protein
MEYHENERRQGDGHSPERNGLDQHTPMRAFCKSIYPIGFDKPRADPQLKTMAIRLHLLDPIWHIPYPQPPRALVQATRWRASAYRAVVLPTT